MQSAVSAILLDKEILLESGTNELELLTFRVGGHTFGINVAKVREVLPATDITLLPQMHGSLRGVFKLRDRVIPCVSLVKHLQIRPRETNSESRMILTDFNQQQTAFLVDEVERIHRLSWERIQAVPPLVSQSRAPLTAVARCDDEGHRMVLLLDFELIIEQVTNQCCFATAVPNPHDVPRGARRIVLADDSPTVRKAVSTTLHHSGYTQLEIFGNGAEAWQWIEERLAAGDPEPVADLVISDVEMPQVDGFHLTKRIKDHPQLRNIPVLLYSSIVTPDNYKKGQAVGADAQISKPELGRVVEMADTLVERRYRTTEASASAVAPLGRTSHASVDTAAAAPPVACDASSVAEASRSKPAAGTSDRATAASKAVPPVAAASRAPSAPAPRGTESAPPTGPSARPPAAGGPSLAAREVAATTAELEPSLWTTFRHEMQDHLQQLRGLLSLAPTSGAPDQMPPAAMQPLCRTLHTIKSAAMVVPCDSVAIATHELEGLIEAARDTGGPWPDEALHRYIDWLSDLLDGGQALATATPLHLLTTPSGALPLGTLPLPMQS